VVTDSPTAPPAGSGRGVALIRAPGPRLADGIVTHIERSPVDLELARRQHAAYVEALAGAGWDIVTVPAADDCPDAVFIEDTLVVADDLAIITRPGVPARQPETATVADTVRTLALRMETIAAPATLDGGDILQIGQMVYAGLGGRTNADGIAQLAGLLSGLGRTTVTVPLRKVLHLKSAVTALPDGTVLAYGDLVNLEPFPRVRPVPEEAGAHVVPLGGPDVLIAASAPRTTELVHALGWHPIVVDITEYERLEGCVTCLSVLIAGLVRPTPTTLTG
jgi:dimethylargininase